MNGYQQYFSGSNNGTGSLTQFLCGAEALFFIFASLLVIVLLVFVILKIIRMVQSPTPRARREFLKEAPAAPRAPFDAQRAAPEAQRIPPDTQRLSPDAQAFLRILNERYAKGEITDEEYRRKRDEMSR